MVIPGGTRADLTNAYGPFPERWWRVLDAVRSVASEVGASPAQVALHWTTIVEGVTSVPIFGGRSVEQLGENLSALEISLSPDQYQRIAKAGRFEREGSPYIYTD